MFGERSEINIYDKEIITLVSLGIGSIMYCE